MSETGIVALAGVIATLISGLGSAWLTNRNNSQREATRAAAEQKDYIRELVVRTIVAARGFGGAITGISMMLATRVSLDAFDRALPEMLNNSDSGVQFVTHGEELRMRLTEAKLLVADPQLMAGLDALLERHQAWMTEAVGGMKDHLKQDPDDIVPRMALWSAYSSSYTKSIDQLEAIASERLRPESPRVSHRRVRA